MGSSVEDELDGTINHKQNIFGTINNSTIQTITDVSEYQNSLKLNSPLMIKKAAICNTRSILNDNIKTVRQSSRKILSKSVNNNENNIENYDTSYPKFVNEEIEISPMKSVNTEVFETSV